MILIVGPRPLFNLGSILATANAVATFPEEILAECLGKHAKCDWGDLCEEDRKSNDAALTSGGRLFSSYEISDKNHNGKLWVITESDRSATTILLPGDY